MIIRKLGNTGFLGFGLATRYHSPQSDTRVFRKHEIRSAEIPKANPQHGFNLFDDNFGVRQSKHPKDNNGTSTLSLRYFLLLNTVNLPELSDNSFRDVTRIHHSAKQLLKTCKLGRRRTKCQADHISSEIIRGVISTEGVRCLEKQPLVTVDQMRLHSFALIAIAFRPDQA